MMKLKYYLLFCLFGFSVAIIAQTDSLKVKLQITRVELEGGYGSNHLTGLTAMPFAFKSQIKGDRLAKSSNLLFKTNRTGTQSYLNINFKYDKKEFSLGYYNMLGASYSKNLYQLLFEGNAPHAGKKMDLKVNAKQLSFAKVSYKLPWKTKLNSNPKKPNWVYRHHLSLHGITKYGSAKTNGTNYLLTSESGINVEGKFNYNYQANNNLGFKGGGIGVGTYAYSRKDQKIRVLQVSNLGFGMVKGNEQVYYHDTSWNYSGINFTLGSQNNFNTVGDSISALLYKQKESEAKLVFLPVNISYEIQSPIADLSINYMAMPGYLPQLSYLRKFYTKKDNGYGIGLQAGGWGLINSVLKYNLFFKGESSKKLQIKVVGLESLALPYSSFSLKMRLDI